MTTTTIRIERAVHERLKQVADKEHMTIRETVDMLLDRYEQDVFRIAVRESVRRLRDDPAAWADYRQEVAAWDATLMDDLKDEPRLDDEDVGATQAPGAR